MSFYTSLSGLQAAQTDMSTISHNLANVSTNGFKKSRTDFGDVIASSLSSDPEKLVGSGVVVKRNVQQFGEGNLTTTSSSLDLAVSGDGFFAVKTSGATPTLSYTRNGAFQVDQNHYITDAQGSFLQAYPVDSEGNITATGADGLQKVQLPVSSGSPVATTSVQLKLNLSSTSTSPTGTFDRSNASTFNNSTATTIYDANGNAETLTNYYVKGATDSNGNTDWTVHSFVGDQELTTGGTKGSTLAFNSAGQMTSPTAAIQFDSFQPSGAPAAQSISFDFSGSSQFSSAFSVASRTQDGKPAGELSGVSVDANGLITASFTNGDNQKLGVVALANFTNSAGLKQTGDSYWQATGVSGSPIMGSANESSFGNLMTGTLEGSNVDTTEELVNLIAAQRNFQANAKALDTQNQISETIFNIRA